MTGETLCDLLKPLIGKSGTISVLINRFGQVTLPTADNKKLTGVELRPDGLVQVDRQSGWAVIDPAEVVAVVWNGDPEDAPGQFL
jgi:hypothetical protein